MGELQIPPYGEEFEACRVKECSVIKYQATVTYIGPLVSEFLDSGIVVLFGEDAPEELRDFAIIHDGHELIELFRVTASKYAVKLIGSTPSVRWPILTWPTSAIWCSSSTERMRWKCPATSV